jgi:hypothetical protein
MSQNPMHSVTSPDLKDPMHSKLQKVEMEAQPLVPVLLNASADVLL